MKLLSSLLLILIALSMWAGGLMADIRHDPTIEQGGHIEPPPEVKTIGTTRVEIQEKVREVYVGVTGLQEFESYKQMEFFIADYRTNHMTEHGLKDCEDYAYDFMLYCLEHGHICSTEIIEHETGDWHMADTIPLGNLVYLVDISSGNIKEYAVKD